MPKGTESQASENQEEHMMETNSRLEEMRETAIAGDTVSRISS